MSTELMKSGKTLEYIGILANARIKGKSLKRRIILSAYIGLLYAIHHTQIP
jgi:hypothetical protein